MPLLAALLVFAASQYVRGEEPSPRPVSAFYEVRADGTGFRKLFEVQDYYPCNSPRISADGRRIAFDGWRSREGEGLTDARVLICDLDGADLHEVCRGAMPSWSPDGRRLACSRYREHQGVWIMDVDGSNARRLDPEGWGIQWSPDGNSVAFTRQTQVVVHRIATGEQRLLFPKQGAPYRHIYWNMSWSHDGSQLAMIAQTDAGRELAIVDAQGAEFGFQRRLAGEFNPMLTWNSAATRLVFPEKINGRTELRQIDPATPDSSRPVSGIPAGQRVASGCWHPDGQRLIVLGHAP